MLPRAEDRWPALHLLTCWCEIPTLSAVLAFSWGWFDSGGEGRGPSQRLPAVQQVLWSLFDLQESGISNWIHLSSWIWADWLDSSEGSGTIKRNVQPRNQVFSSETQVNNHNSTFFYKESIICFNVLFSSFVNLLIEKLINAYITHILTISAKWLLQTGAFQNHKNIIKTQLHDDEEWSVCRRSP